MQRPKITASAEIVYRSSQQVLPGVAIKVLAATVGKSVLKVLLRGIMMRLLSVYLIIGWMVACMSVAQATSLSPAGFLFDGGSVALPGTASRAEAWWNPARTKVNPNVQAPGFHVSFFGHGSGCGPGASNGPVVKLSSDLAAKSAALTGIAADAASQSWSPALDPSLCTGATSLLPGPAFVFARQNPPGGIGLFTYVGNGARLGGPSFWHQYTTDGQTGKGANGLIEGTFVTWIFDWRSRNTVVPWSGRYPVMTLRTVQSAPAAVVTPDGRSEDAIQVKQQNAITFINPACLQTAAKKTLCQIRFMFETTLLQAGEITRQQEQYFDQAHLLLDPAQAGLPVIFGPLKAAGQPTVADSAGLDLWHSRGDATQRGVFRNKTFVAEISFAEFSNSLRLIAARMTSATAAKVTEKDLSELFGPTWNSPSAWLLADVNMGQEVHSPAAEAYIGGSLTRLEISAQP